MSFLITPILFTCGALIWYTISLQFTPYEKGGLLVKQPTYIKAVLGGFILFGDSVWTGAKIILSSRKFVWLLLGTLSLSMDTDTWRVA